MIEIEHIFVATAHRYFGRHGQSPADAPIVRVTTVECVAGRGLRGDRFFGYRPDYKGQVTLFAAEVFEELCRAFPHARVEASALRRNLVVRGATLSELVGREFEIQGVHFVGTEECRPCYWMDTAVAPGAEAWLHGRGGLRCRVLSSGWLRVAAPSPQPSAPPVEGPTE